MKKTPPKKFIVITSIFAPTEAVRKFALLKDWQLLVVGDTKTPKDWQHPNVVYLSPEDQEKLSYPLIQYIPWKSYSRKIIGYLYAIEHGAEIIADTDDDNIPYEGWGENISFDGKFDTIDQNNFVNVYSQYTDKHVWPRGFPLDKILTPQKIQPKMKAQKVGIWQFLADGDPDVDAIYRLTNNTPIYFEKGSLLVLEKGTLCPFNSQNTFFTKEFFPLLYLPMFVNFRFTDILRGLLAQPLLWSQDAKLGFGPATVVQERNPHDYLKDFDSEIPCYLYAEKIIEVAQSGIKKGTPLKKNIVNVYKELHKNNLVTEEELKALNVWLKNF